MSADSTADDDAFITGLDGLTDNGGDVAATPLIPLDLLALIAWHEAGGPRLIPRMKRGQALMVLVPSEIWYDPIKAIVDREKTGAIVFEGKRKSGDKKSSDAFVVELLQDGRGVVGITVDAGLLPPLLRTSADTELVIPTLSPDLVRRAIAGYFGQSSPVVNPDDVAGLDLIEIAAAIRPSSSPQASLRRLRQASARKAAPGPVDDTPLLSELSGYGEAKAWCLDLCAALDEARAGTISYGEIESGIFFGPPGTGKTLLARSLARSARVPLIATSVPDWFMRKTGHLGDVIQQIDEVFTQALSQAPSVLFLDEIDALPDRAVADARSREWWSSVVSALLTRIDACRAARRGVVLLAATNHLSHLDAALTRPGRFDRKLHVPPPDTAGLAAILRSHLKGDLAELDLLPLARLMPGATGADVTAIVKAARRFARGEGRPLGLADLHRATLPADGRSETERRHVAIHEAGHAAVALALGFEVARVSIRSQGTIGGVTEHAIPSVSTLADIERRVLVLLAGRAANMLMGAAPDTGAANDISEATRLLTAAQVSFGLGDGLVTRTSPEAALGLVGRDLALASTIDIRLESLMRRAHQLVADKRVLIEAITDALMRQQVVDGDELVAIACRNDGEADELGSSASPPAATSRV
ncbi:AAA family ATPase [Bosea thiooxidans]